MSSQRTPLSDTKSRSYTSGRFEYSTEALLENELVKDDVKHGTKSWYHYLWDTFDKPPEERWFLFKLDAVLLTLASLGVSRY